MAPNCLAGLRKVSVGSRGWPRSQPLRANNLLRREWIQLAGSQQLFESRRQVLHPPVVHHWNGQDTLPSHSIIGDDSIIGGGDYCAVARKCAGGCLNVSSRLAANAVTAVSSQIADKGKTFQAGNQ